VKKWFRTERPYLIIGDFEYWTMSYGVPPGAIINRQKAPSDDR
jgi:hypothetical protein